ncbi:MAG: S9 family peptidase [Synergistaceae bacterium]|nr:S9 family peptidase [Synergistaceae bacterium]
MTRHVEQQDFLKFHFPSNPSFSPGGGHIAFRVSRPDMEKNGYASDLWVHDLKSGTNRQMTFSGAEKFFCWSADGASLIFASERSGKKDGKGTSFYSMALEGGEAAPLFRIPLAAASIRALDERRCLITAAWECEIPENPDVLVFDQVPFMSNGKGYTGRRRVGLAVCDMLTGGVRLLTPPGMEVSRCVLNREKSKALVVAVEYADVKPLNNAVHEMDLFTGAMKLLSGGLAFTFVHAAWLGDAVLVTGTDHKKTGVNENLKFYFLEDGRLECLTPDMDSSLTNAVTADGHYGCSADLAGAFFPYRSGLGAGAAFKGPIFCSTDVMKSRLCELNGDERPLQLTFRTSAVVDYCVEEKSGRAAFVAYEGLYPTELYLLEPGGEKRLTSFNRPLFEELRLSQPIHVTVDNGQGWKLDGWYMKPTDFRERKKYPAVLHIHGGPKAAFGDLYHHEMQCWAAKGYAVLYCNPRGGDGRGSAFEDIRGRYGDIDYHDLTAFTDWCVRNLSFVDSARLGVTGGSYGGYMTNWIVTRTHRFKAAVSQRGISNWVSKFGCCDIGYYYVEDQHLGTPWKDAEKPWAESPLKYADRVKTPILFIHSEDDFRCELGQAFQMFTALKVLGVESRLCVFKGENHELSRSGRPRSRLARLREIQSWFDTHL